jgi:hypothetical protein
MRCESERLRAGCRHRKLWLSSSKACVSAVSFRGEKRQTHPRLKSASSSSSLNTGVLLHFGAASLAGFVTVAVTSPFDVLRTRLMRDSARDSLYGGSFFKCLSSTVRADGVAAFWRGAELQWLRIAPHYVITLITLEWLRKMNGLAPIR